MSNTENREFSSIWKWIRRCNDVMNHADCHSDHLGQFYESSPDVCRRTTSGSDNNPHSNVNNNLTMSNVFDFKQYEVDKMYSPQCKRETIANFHGHALSVLSLIKKSMKKSMSTVKVREFPEFGEHQLCVIANR